MKTVKKLVFLCITWMLVILATKSVFASSELSNYKISGYPKFPKVSQSYYIIYDEGYRKDRREICFFDIANKSSDTYVRWDGRGVDIINGKMINDIKYYLSDDNKWLKFEQGYGRCSDYAKSIYYSNLNIYNSNGTRVIKARPIKYIKFEKKKYTADVGDKFTVKCLTNIKGTIKYKSSNKKIASVNSKGKIKAKKPGTVTITATASTGEKATCKIYVQKE